MKKAWSLGSDKHGFYLYWLETYQPWDLEQVIFSVLKSSHLKEKKKKQGEISSPPQKMQMKQFPADHERLLGSNAQKTQMKYSAQDKHCLMLSVTTDIRIHTQLKSHRPSWLLSICSFFVPIRFKVNTCAQHLIYSLEFELIYIYILFPFPRLNDAYFFLNVFF